MPYVQDISPSGAPVGESMIGTLAANLDRYQKARDERTRQINTINTALAQRGLQDKVTGTVDANGKMNFNLKGSGNESDTAAWEIANRLYQDDKTRIRSGTKMSREDVSDKAVSQIKDMAEDQRKNVDTRAYNITVAQQQKVPTPYGQLIGGNNNATTTNNLQAGIAAAGQLQSQNPMNSSGNTQSAAPVPSSTVLTPNTPSQTIGTQQQGALLSPSTGQPIVTAGSAAQSATNAPSATSGATASNAAATPPTTQTNSQKVSSGQSEGANYVLKGSYKTGDVEADLPTSVVTTTVDNSFVDSIKTDIDKLMFASAMQSAIGNTDQAANFAKLAEKRHADMAKYTELLNSSGTSVAVDKSKMKITGAEGTAEASEGQNAKTTITVDNKTSVGASGGGAAAAKGRWQTRDMNGQPVTYNFNQIDANGKVLQEGPLIPMANQGGKNVNLNTELRNVNSNLQTQLISNGYYADQDTGQVYELKPLDRNKGYMLSNFALKNGKPDISKAKAIGALQSTNDPNNTNVITAWSVRPYKGQNINKINGALGAPMSALSN